MHRCIAVACVAIGLAACGGGGGGDPGTPPPPATPGLARTTCGDYQGTDTGGSWRFLGLRYAAAPVGNQRWKSPAAPTCPGTTVAASDYAPVCPQLDRSTGAPEGSEDCLAVNVWSPKAAFGGARAPVMFFIHGGGNVIGSAREEVDQGRVLYDGQRLAEATGHVVVTVQYRLGALGWLVHPGLDVEAADGRSGNYGTEDLIAALRWVEREIAAFGGNRDRVMIFGESAGGVNVCTLLASPQAAGLFDAALIQSGGCVADTRTEALATGTTVAANGGCSAAADPVACLRGKTPAEIMAALPPVVTIGGGQPPFGPSIDGTTMPDAPLQVIRSGAHNRVPVVLGANADETGQEVPLTYTNAQYQAMLAATFPNAAIRAQVEALYSPTTFGSARRAYIALSSDVKFICPSRTMARTLAAAQTVPVFRYFFTEVPDAPSSPAFGAFHGLELVYLFGVLNVQGYTPTAAETSLSGTMQQYWANLAAAGQPGGGSLPVWTPYVIGRDNHLVLEAGNVREADGVITARCDFWDTLIPPP